MAAVKRGTPSIPDPFSLAWEKGNSRQGSSKYWNDVLQPTLSLARERVAEDRVRELSPLTPRTKQLVERSGEGGESEIGRRAR